MQQNLSRLIRELKKETCPQRVRDQVRGRISARASSPGWLRLGIPLAAAALVLVCGVSVWHLRAGEKARHQAELAERAAQERAQIAHQAEGALGLIGRVLADAKAHSEKVIYDRAVPPLRNSLRTANNKIIHNMQL
jgi:anti-sigma factor RsiW